MLRGADGPSEHRNSPICLLWKLACPEKQARWSLIRGVRWGYQVWVVLQTCKAPPGYWLTLMLKKGEGKELNTEFSNSLKEGQSLLGILNSGYRRQSRTTDCMKVELDQGQILGAHSKHTMLT